MKRILVATDFSTRSDRALRRAALLAREKAAELVLVHVVDDDQPPSLVQSEQREATAILHDLAATMQKIDGLACETHLALGDPFQAIGNAAETFDADLVVMGPHRRQILREVFVGTTVERTIRQSQRPVIMANAVPAKPYERILIATDLSDCSAQAVQAVRKLGFLDSAEVGALHAFDAPPKTLMLSAWMMTAEIKNRIAEEEARASAELGEFLRKVQFKPSTWNQRCLTRALCHPERSEGPLGLQERSLAALGMTAGLYQALAILGQTAISATHRVLGGGGNPGLLAQVARGPHRARNPWQVGRCQDPPGKCHRGGPARSHNRCAHGSAHCRRGGAAGPSRCRRGKTDVTRGCRHDLGRVSKIDAICSGRQDECEIGRAIAGVQ